MVGSAFNCFFLSGGHANSCCNLVTTPATQTWGRFTQTVHFGAQVRTAVREATRRDRALISQVVVRIGSHPAEVP